MIAKTFSDIHIYHNKLEYFIRLVAWWICWIGGVGVLWASKDGVGSAFFVLALSQLMEFLPQISEKKYWGSKLAHAFFCISITLVLLISIKFLFGGEYNADYHKTMNILSLVSMAYISVDCILMILIDEQKNNAEIGTDSISDSAAKRVFEKSLQGGSLGNI